MAVHYLPSAKYANLLFQCGFDSARIEDILLDGEAVEECVDEEVDEASDDTDVNSVPIIKLANLILTQSIEQGIYELHLEPTKSHFLARYRSRDELFTAMKMPLHVHRSITGRIKLMAMMDNHSHIPSLGVLKIKWNGRPYDFRVLSMPTANGERLCLHRWRKFGDNRPTLQLDDLGLEPFVLERYRTLCRKRGGAVILTGPYDCGKTTTLFATLRELNSPDVNIMTGEYEIEHLLEGVNQSLATWSGPSGTTFGCRFKAARKQAADIVLAKFEEFDNACEALRTAISGVSVFGSMHFSSPFQVIDYFRWNMSRREAWLVREGIKAIVSRRFIGVPCRFCKEEYEPSRELLESFSIDENCLTRLKLDLPLEDVRFFRAHGCKRCQGNRTGLKGYEELSTGVFEALFMTEELKELIRNDRPREQMRAVAARDGHLSLRDSALRKAILGETTLEQVVCVTSQS